MREIATIVIGGCTRLVKENKKTGNYYASFFRNKRGNANDYKEKWQITKRDSFDFFGDHLTRFKKNV